jgi:anti-sigma regulatory factor (Ser/Thr protein kinase)
MTHELFAYDDDSAFERHMPPFVAEGVDEGEAVVVVLTAANRELMGDALGAVSDRVTFVACEDHYTRPEAALADYDANVRGYLRNGATGVRLCGELPDFERDDEWAGWVGYEAILNRAFAHYPVQIMCVYDERRLPGSVVDGARRAHPDLAGDVHGPNPEFGDPADVVRTAMRRPVEPLPELTALPDGSDALAFRSELRRALAEARVPDADARGMLIAADEVLANAHRHGGGTSLVRCGRVGDRFVCEIADHGAGYDDPLAGYLPPRPQATDGAGLWVARQLTRDLDLLPTPNGGLAARLWI